MVTRFKASTIPEVASRFAKVVDNQLTAICPITGLSVINDFPSYPGAVISSLHPIAYEALALLDLPPQYIEGLTNKQAAGLVLGCLHALNKIDLKVSSLLANSLLEVKCTGGQLLVLLRFIKANFINPTRCYPRFEFTKNFDELAIDRYIKLCVDIQNYYGSIDWQQKQFLVEKKAREQAKAPIFLSGAAEGKRLDRECYEAWLELASHLPSTFKAKAKPHIKTLASTDNGQLVNKLVASAANYVGDDEFGLESGEAVLAWNDFKAIVEKNRAEAEAMGLHKDIFDLDPIDTSSAGASELSPKAEVEEEKVVTKPSTFQERMAAKLAAKENRV